MRKVSTAIAIGGIGIASLAAVIHATPAAAFGLRIGPFHVGVPFFGHHHRHYSMHANPREAVRSEDSGSNPSRYDAAPPPETADAVPQGVVSPALLYPNLALPVTFQNIFWPQSSLWPFGYQNILTTAFARPPSEQEQRQCQQVLDASAMFGRIREQVDPTAEQMPLLQRLGGALGAASGYLARACAVDIPAQPTARLQMMQSRIQELAMAIDIIRQPLQEFEQSLTPQQQARFSGLPASQPTSRSTFKSASKSGARAAAKSAARTKPAVDEQIGAGAAARPCGGSPTAIDWSISEIKRSVQPTDTQQGDLAEVKKTFNAAADDLDAHCPASMPKTPLARLHAIEARLDSAWRAVLLIQVALADFEAKLTDEQRDRFDAMNFASR